MFQLLAQTRDLNRRIYTSLPWGYRVAGLLAKIAFSLTDALGRVVYAEFIKNGVEGMPPVRGKEADPAVHGNPDRLPPEYGKRFGERLYAMTLGKVRNPNKVDDILSDFMANVARKGFALKPKSSLKEAEMYAVSALKRLTLDAARKDMGRRYDRGHDIELDVDVMDPASFKLLDKMLPHSELSRLMHEVSTVDSRAVSWLEAMLNGVKKQELAEEWGVSAPRISQWESKNLPKIQKIVREYLDVAA